MEFFVIGLVACFASLLTFVSGFGLGTILTPAFLLFFPIEIAIPLTGIVHLLNNIFKFSLVWKYLNKEVLLRFGTTAIAGAFIGAGLLLVLAKANPLATYTLGEKSFSILPGNLVIGALMVFFALFEMVPALKKVQFGKKALIPGGILSGFFGGLSGHQGALRSAFLIKFGLTKEEYISTGIAIACFVDFTRLGVYFGNIEKLDLGSNYPILVTATLCAFAGAYLGRLLLKKITINFVQYTVSVLMILLAIALAVGLV